MAQPRFRSSVNASIAQLYFLIHFLLCNRRLLLLRWRTPWLLCQEYRPVTPGHVTFPGRAGGAGWMVTDILLRWVSKEGYQVYVQVYEEYLDQPFLAYFWDISLIKKYRRPRSRFDIMESIMANITFPFALLLSFPPIVCLAMLAAVGHSIYNRYFHPPTKTARSYKEWVRYGRSHCLPPWPSFLCRVASIFTMVCGPNHQTPALQELFTISQRWQDRDWEISGCKRRARLYNHQAYVWAHADKITVLLYRDRNFDEMLTDSQSKHENALAKEFVKHNKSQMHSLMIFVIQGSCKPRALMATS